MTNATRRLSAITGSIALLLIVVWYFALFSPQGKTLAKAHKAEAAANGQKVQLQSQIATLNALVKEIPQDQAKLATYKQAVPDDPQLPAALDAIQTAATNSGVTLSMTDPTNTSSGVANGTSSGVAATKGTPSMPVLMNVKGSFQQITAFVTALTAMPRTVVIQSLNVTGDASGSTGQPGLQVAMSTDLYYAGKSTP